jgi:hypothetical protein
MTKTVGDENVLPFLQPTFRQTSTRLSTTILFFLDKYSLRRQELHQTLDLPHQVSGWNGMIGMEPQAGQVLTDQPADPLKLGKAIRPHSGRRELQLSQVQIFVRSCLAHGNGSLQRLTADHVVLIDPASCHGKRVGWRVLEGDRISVSTTTSDRRENLPRRVSSRRGKV